MRILLRNDLDERLAEEFANVERVAWDIETSGLNPHVDRIGTVQLHAPEIGSIVVQVGAPVPKRLSALLASEQILKVFHHAMFDLRFMVAHWQVSPARVACTKVASKLLAPSLPNAEHSLQSLLAKHLHITIRKDERLTDWLATDLTPEQLAYACGDVEHLLPLLHELAARLDQAGLSEVFQSCLDFLPTRVVLDLGKWPDVFAY